MKLVDEIRDLTESFVDEFDMSFEDFAQAAIDVVERRLSEIRVESNLESLDFEKNTATFSVPENYRWLAGEYFIIDKAAWQAVKDGE